MNLQNWLEKSLENLATAQWCLAQGHFNACANRLYYAMFHAGAAALLRHGVMPPKEKVEHDWLQANFSSFFIHRRKILPAKFQPYLWDAQAVRIIADYRFYSVSKSVASRELKKAVEFVNTIHQELFHDAQS